MMKFRLSEAMGRRARKGMRDGSIHGDLILAWELGLGLSPVVGRQIKQSYRAFCAGPCCVALAPFLFGNWTWMPPFAR